jgi:hypothetical protein
VLCGRGGLQWEGPYKRGGLKWEGPYKRGGLQWEGPYKREATSTAWNKLAVKTNLSQICLSLARFRIHNSNIKYTCNFNHSNRFFLNIGTHLLIVPE